MIAFEDPSFWGYVWAIVYAVVVDWFLVSLAVASTCSYVANKYLRQRHSHSVEQEVEWMYAFDVHLNSYMCSFMLTHVLQVTCIDARCFMSDSCTSVVFAVFLPSHAT